MQLGIASLGFGAPISSARAGWPTAYADAVSLTETAADLGFADVWIRESHSGSIGDCPAALVACAAMLARTTSIGVCAAVTDTSLYPHHWLAENAHRLAIDSGGRFSLGIGASAREPDASFLERMSDRRPRTQVWVHTRSPKMARLSGLAGHWLLLGAGPQDERSTLIAQYQDSYRGNAEPAVGLVRDMGEDVEEDAERLVEAISGDERLGVNYNLLLPPAEVRVATRQLTFLARNAAVSEWLCA